MKFEYCLSQRTVIPWFLQVKLGISVKDLQGGPGLAFIAYPTAVAQMPLPQLWAAAFFFMMVLLAIDSEFGTIEAIVGPLQDYPFFQRIRKEVLIAIGDKYSSYFALQEARKLTIHNIFIVSN